MLAKQVQLDEIPPYGWSRESVDLINRLIQRRPEARLGTNGIEEVKQHPFFKKMDWEKLEQRKILAPFLPQVQRSPRRQSRKTTATTRSASPRTRKSRTWTSTR